MIYPPMLEYRADPQRIWKGVQNLCCELHACASLQTLSITFMEDDIAKWSKHGNMWDTFHHRRSRSKIDCDLVFHLDLFSRLTSVTKVEIHIPESLRHWKELQCYVERTKEVITNRVPPRPNLVENVIWPGSLMTYLTLESPFDWEHKPDF